MGFSRTMTYMNSGGGDGGGGRGGSSDRVGLGKMRAGWMKAGMVEKWRVDGQKFADGGVARVLEVVGFDVASTASAAALSLPNCHCS